MRIIALLALFLSIASCRFSAKIPSTKAPPSQSSPAGTPAETPGATSGTASLSVSDGPTYGYGSITVGNTSDKSFTVTNSGDGSATSLTGTLSTSNFVFKGGAYPGTGGTCSTTLSASGTCTLVVTFTPQSSGAKSDTISLTFSGGTATRALTGTGLSVASLSIDGGATFDFGSVSTAASSDHTFTVTNSGETTATSMSANAFGTGHFTFKGGTYPGTGGDCSTSLSGSGTCSVVVTFGPSSVGLKNDTVSLNYSTGVASTTATRDVQGTGIVYGPSGTLDTSFNTTGSKTVDVGGGFDQTAQAIVSQTDGKLLVGGLNISFAAKLLSRFKTNGNLDTSFSTDGIQLSAGAPSNSEILDLDIDTGGRIYGAVRNPNSNTSVAVYRYRTDGSIDTSFNTAGMALVSIVANPLNGASVVLQSDGKVLFQTILQSTMIRRVYRFLSDGNLDTSFRTGGWSTWSNTIGPTGSGLGKIRLDTSGRPISINYESSLIAANTGIVRFSTDGQLDTAFASTGSLTTTLLTSGYGVTVDTAGKIIAVGHGIPFELAAIRILSNGQMDTSFATTGRFARNMGAMTQGLRGVVAQSNRIVAFGSWTTDVLAIGINTSGVLDTSFRTNGEMQINLAWGVARATDLKVQSVTGSLCGTAYDTNGAATTGVFCFTP